MTLPIRRGVRGLWALAWLALVSSACRDRVGQGWDWERMRAQPRYAPYGPSALFANGMAMRVPPAGTVTRESASLTDPPWGAGAASAVIVRRGASRFAIYCAVCHGERGDGVSVVASNMDPPRPPSLLVPPASTLSASDLVRVMTNGLGRMPSYAAELPVRDRWAVAAYIATFPLPVAGSSSTAPAVLFEWPRP
jgi:mono/diheme cytochrome c family protein